MDSTSSTKLIGSTLLLYYKIDMAQYCIQTAILTEEDHKKKISNFVEEHLRNLKLARAFVVHFMSQNSANNFSKKTIFILKSTSTSTLADEITSAYSEYKPDFTQAKL